MAAGTAAIPALTISPAITALFPTTEPLPADAAAQVYFSKDGTLYLCNDFFSRLIQWIKDFLWDDKIQNISYVFQATALEYFSKKDLPLTQTYTADLKRVDLAALRERLATIIVVIQANTPAFERIAPPNTPLRLNYTDYTTREALTEICVASPMVDRDTIRTLQGLVGEFQTEALLHNEAMDEIRGQLESVKRARDAAERRATAPARSGGGMEGNSGTEELRVAVATLQSQLEQKERQINQLKQSVKDTEIIAEQGIEFKLSEAADRAKEEARKPLLKDIEKLTKDNQTYLEELDALGKDNAKLKSNLDEEGKKYVDLMGKLGNNPEAIPAKLAALQKTSQELAAARAANETLGKTVESLKNEKAEQMKKDAAAIKKLEADVKRLETQTKELKAQVPAVAPSVTPAENSKEEQTL